MADVKRLLRRVDPRGRFSALCHLQDGVWHLYVRVGGEFADKGPCKHDHAEVKMTCCCGDPKCGFNG